MSGLVQTANGAPSSEHQRTAPLTSSASPSPESPSLSESSANLKVADVDVVGFAGLLVIDGAGGATVSTVQLR